jgi:hypothetical protein
MSSKINCLTAKLAANRKKIAAYTARRAELRRES